MPELCGVEVVGLHWERIQLVLRLRLTLGSSMTLQDGELFLRHPAGRREPLAAQPARSDDPTGVERWVRFNVFAGTGQMPLEPAGWKLSIRREGHQPEWCGVAAALEFMPPIPAARDFLFSDEMYRVNVRPASTEPTLTFGISTWRRSTRHRPATPLRTVGSWWRRSRRTAWRRLFQALVTTLRLFPRRGRLVVFTSDSREALGGNLKLVHDRMTERGLGHPLRLRTIFKASIRVRRTIGDRMRLVWLLARADVILVDGYQPAIYNLPRRREQRIIQLWHAWGAFKTVGYSRIGKPGGPSPYSRVHKNYSYATASSTHEVPFYAEAFGLPEERVVPTGAPSMDDFLDQSLQATRRQRAYEAVPAARDRTVILLAPTFRGGGARRAHYPVDLIDVDAAYALCEHRNATLLIRMHPFVRDRVEIPPEYRDRLVDASDLPVETNDLLLITDLLVTDYSSLVFEYSTLGRPMLFFAYDLEEYVATRDFYEPYEAFVPGRIVRTFDELIDAISREDYQVEKVAHFAARHMPAGEGSATDRIIDELILPS